MAFHIQLKHAALQVRSLNQIYVVEKYYIWVFQLLQSTGIYCSWTQLYAEDGLTQEEKQTNKKTVSIQRKKCNILFRFITHSTDLKCMCLMFSIPHKKTSKGQIQHLIKLVVVSTAVSVEMEAQHFSSISTIQREVNKWDTSAWRHE